jgi:hypothetical protein
MIRRGGSAYCVTGGTAHQTPAGFGKRHVTRALCFVASADLCALSRLVFYSSSTKAASTMSKKIQMYYSSATGNLKVTERICAERQCQHNWARFLCSLQVKKDHQSMKFLLQKKNAQFEEIDMAQMDKPARDKVSFFAVVYRLPSVVLPKVFAFSRSWRSLGALCCYP